MLEITSIQHSESATTTYSLVSLLQRCISSESATMIVFHTDITILKKRVYRSKRKTNNKSKKKTHTRQIKKNVRSERTSNQEEEQLINQKERILARDIDRFVILIDLILRQNLIKIEKLEFAFFASMYVREKQSSHLSSISFDWHIVWTCYDQIVWTKSQWNRHVE